MPTTFHARTRNCIWSLLLLIAQRAGMNITEYIHSTVRSRISFFSRSVHGWDGERAINNCIRIPLVADSRHVKSAATHVVARGPASPWRHPLAKKWQNVLQHPILPRPCLALSRLTRERASGAFLFFCSARKELSYVILPTQGPSAL